MMRSACPRQWRALAIGFIAGILLLLANHRVFALFLPVSLDDFIARTPVILHVQVESVDRIIPDAACPAIIKSTVIQKLKGPIPVDPSKAFTFQGSDSLKPGRAYILFIRPVYDGGVYQEPGNFRQGGSDQIQHLVKCGPFHSRQEAAWEINDESVASGFSSLLWPAAISLTQTSASEPASVSRQELFTYIEKSVAGTLR